MARLSKKGSSFIWGSSKASNTQSLVGGKRVKLFAKKGDEEVITVRCKVNFERELRLRHGA